MDEMVSAFDSSASWVGVSRCEIECSDMLKWYFYWQGNGSVICYHPVEEFIVVGCQDGR